MKFFGNSGCSSHHMQPTGDIERVEVHKTRTFTGVRDYHSVVRVERTHCVHEGCDETGETEKRFTVYAGNFGHDFLEAIENDEYHPDGGENE